MISARCWSQVTRTNIVTACSNSRASVTNGFSVFGRDQLISWFMGKVWNNKLANTVRIIPFNAVNVNLKDERVNAYKTQSRF